MLRYMLDTDICIYVIKTYSPRLRDRFNELGGQMCISSITFAELRYGAEKSARRLRNLEEVEIFTDRIESLPFSQKAAAHYGEIRAELERTGSPIGLHDMLIGSHARSEGLVMVTNNRRQFDRIAGLRVENWV